jgi:hypothetical protein
VLAFRALTQNRERKPWSTPTSRKNASSTGKLQTAIQPGSTATDSRFLRYYPQRTTSNEGLSRQPSPTLAHDTPTPTPPRALPLGPGLGIAGAFESCPQPSEDKALTAFAQLGALRLNARRCLISFFDRRNCYILAEATRTCSLHTGQPEFTEDSLFWGNTIFPKEKSICYYTVNLASDQSGLPFEDYSKTPCRGP